MSLEGDPNLVEWTDSSGTMHVLNADIVLSADDTRSLTLTSNPVEGGSAATDHVIHNPDKLKLEIGQTQTPIEQTTGFSNQTVTLNFAPSPVRGVTAIVINAIGGLLGLNGKQGQINVVVLGADTPLDRVNDLHDQLIAVKQNAYPLKVTFKGRIHPVLIVTSVKLSHVKGEFGFGRFTLELESFNTVSTATAKLPDPASLRAKAAKSAGQKPPSAGDDPKNTRSFLKSLTNKIGITGS